jgi:hypothetical protein
MPDFEPIPVRFTVFREEYPALYDYIASLPNSRQRKRNAFLRAMEVGAEMLLSGLPPKVPAPANGAAHRPGVEAVPSIGSARVVQDSAPEVIIDAGDLTELFG